MKQLKMIRYKGEYKSRALPEGYSFAFFDGSQADIDSWCDICRGANMLSNPDNNEAFRKVILSVRGIEPIKDLFFVVAPDGRRAATCTLISRADEKGTVSGYLHMVAALPEFRNLGLGHAMVSFSNALSAERDIDYCILTTDDYRLPAIKNYLVGGYRPVIYEDPESDMRSRWLAVAEKLGISSLDFVEE